MTFWIQTRRLGKWWFSFSNRWFSGSLRIFHGVFHPSCVMHTLFKPKKHDHQNKNNFKHSKLIGISAYIGSMYLHPGTVTRILTFLVGHPYKPLFVTATGLGVDRKHTAILARARFHNDFWGLTDRFDFKDHGTVRLAWFWPGVLFNLASLKQTYCWWKKFQTTAWDV